MRFAMAAAAVLFLAQEILAQDVRFGEKIEVRLIEVDAVVTDHDGHRVYGLTADDFEVYEGRARQTISNFSEYRATPEASARPSAVGAPAGIPPAHAREPHALVVLLDSVPQKDFVRQKMFDQLEQMLATTVHAGDRVAVVMWSGEHLRTIVEASDPAVVMSAVRAFSSRMNDVADDPHRVEEQEAAAYASHPEIAGRDQIGGFGGRKTISNDIGSDAALMVFHRKTAAVARLVATLGTQPGRKALLYVSQKFKLEGADPGNVTAKRYISEITTAANASGVTFYAARPFMPDDSADASEPSERFVDADDWMLNVGALERVTDATGGLLGFARSSVGTIAPQIAEDLESYYSIAYRARSDGGDRVRNIKVRTKNPAYRVRARTEVVEKSMATKAKEAIVSRLFVDEGPNDIQFEVHQGELKRTSGNRWLLPIFVKIPASQLQFADEHGKRTAHAGVLIASANGVAEVTPVSENELRIVDPQDLDNGFVTYSVEILGDKRGSKVSIGIVDRRTGALGVRTIDNRGRFR